MPLCSIIGLISPGTHCIYVTFWFRKYIKPFGFANLALVFCKMIALSAPVR
jgi:hypothetical protein